MPKLLAYKKFTSKAGKPCCVATVISDLSEREKSNGYVGVKVDEVFMPDKLTDYLKPEHINHELILDYSVSGGRAFLENVTVK